MRAIIYTLVAIVAVTASAQQGPRVVGNGGGGVKNGNTYMTFGSTGFYINPVPLGVTPNMTMVMNGIRNLRAPEKEMTAKMLAAVVPFGQRKYFDVTPLDLTEETMKKIIEEYAKVTGIDPKNLELYAITDKLTTYLLPNFYKLQLNEQAAILWHEAYWILKPSASYKEVIEAEVIFQKFLKVHPVFLPEVSDMMSRLAHLAIGSSADKYSIPLRMDFAEDMRANHLWPMSDKHGLKLDFFGKDLIQLACKGGMDGYGEVRFDMPELTVKLFEQLQARPNSHFLKRLSWFMSQVHSDIYAIPFGVNPAAAHFCNTDPAEMKLWRMTPLYTLYMSRGHLKFVFTRIPGI